jgi:hypothetical protein
MILFADYHHFMIQELQKTFGTQITYKRREVIIAENIPAIPAKSDTPIDQTAAKTLIKTVNRNYIVQLSLLKLDGTPIEPKTGDRIIEGELEYEVVNGENKQCFRPIDPDNLYARIFVHKVK